MYRRTGDAAFGNGVYHSECPCRTEITVRRGEKFPVCPRCKAAVGWLFSRAAPTGPPPPGRKPVNGKNGNGKGGSKHHD